MPCWAYISTQDHAQSPTHVVCISGIGYSEDAINFVTFFFRMPLCSIHIFTTISPVLMILMTF